MAIESNLNPELSCALYAPHKRHRLLTIAAVGNAMDNGAELMLSIEGVAIAKT